MPPTRNLPMAAPPPRGSGQMRVASSGCLEAAAAPSTSAGFQLGCSSSAWRAGQGWGVAVRAEGARDDCSLCSRPCRHQDSPPAPKSPPPGVPLPGCLRWWRVLMRMSQSSSAPSGAALMNRLQSAASDAPPQLPLHPPSPGAAAGSRRPSRLTADPGSQRRSVTPAWWLASGRETNVGCSSVAPHPLSCP